MYLPPTVDGDIGCHDLFWTSSYGKGMKGENVQTWGCWDGLVLRVLEGLVWGFFGGGPALLISQCTFMHWGLALLEQTFATQVCIGVSTSTDTSNKHQENALLRMSFHVYTIQHHGAIGKAQCLNTFFSCCASLHTRSWFGESTLLPRDVYLGSHVGIQ